MMTDQDWAVLIFGSVEAWERAKPSRQWLTTGDGLWFSSERGPAAESALARAIERKEAA